MAGTVLRNLLKDLVKAGRVARQGRLFHRAGK